MNIRLRAISWRSCSDDTSSVGQWRDNPTDAIADALAHYQPFLRRVYEIEGTDGTRRELSDAQYDEAAERYHASIANRDAVGVWG